MLKKFSVAKLCPDGVEFKKLGDIALIKARIGWQGLTKDEYLKDGEYYLVTGVDFNNDLIDWKNCHFVTKERYDQDTNIQIKNDDVLVTKDGTLGKIAFVKNLTKPATLNSGVFLVRSLYENVNNRFLFHYLKSPFLMNFARGKLTGGTIKHLNQSVITQLPIPIPPLPVQNEIVRMLDTFTELIATLEEELKLRKIQYEYYRDKLLTFDNVPMVKLGEIAFYSRERIAAENLTENNYIGVDNLLSDKRGKIISSHLPNTGNCTKFFSEDILIGNIRPYLKKIWFADCEGGASGDVLTIRVADKNLIRPKFLYYCLASDNFFYHYNNSSKGGKMPRGDKNFVMDFKIPIPPIEEQERIVNILDKFDKLCNDLCEGIPAEIAARKKQYEYYRDLLLTFEEKN